MRPTQQPACSENLTRSVTEARACGEHAPARTYALQLQVTELVTRFEQRGCDARLHS